MPQRLVDGQVYSAALSEAYVERSGEGVIALCKLVARSEGSLRVVLDPRQELSLTKRLEQAEAELAHGGKRGRVAGTSKLAEIALGSSPSAAARRHHLQASSRSWAAPWPL